LTSNQSVGLIQGDCSHTGVSQMLSHFQNQTIVNSFYLEFIIIILWLFMVILVDNLVFSVFIVYLYNYFYTSNAFRIGGSPSSN
jgi:hypothetical protein